MTARKLGRWEGAFTKSMEKRAVSPTRMRFNYNQQLAIERREYKNNKTNQIKRTKQNKRNKKTKTKEDISACCLLYAFRENWINSPKTTLRVGESAAHL